MNLKSERNFSIVIPTFNRARKLQKALDSVLSQTYQNYEILIIDDGSTDSTRSIVEEYKDKRVRYFWMPNSGAPARPRNKGILEANFEWISFLDSDDIWYPNKLEEVSKHIDAKDKFQCICHDEYVVDITGGKKVNRYGPFAKNFYIEMILYGNRISTSTVTLNKNFLLKNNLFFNEDRNFSIVEDYDLWLKMAYHGAAFKFLSLTLGEYIVDSQSISSDTVLHRCNLESLLRYHVYNYQKLNEPDNLWSKVLIQLKFATTLKNKKNTG
jgi:glycosyltransferase involved in cell wall biosynthesis